MSDNFLASQVEEYHYFSNLSPAYVLLMWEHFFEWIVHLLWQGSDCRKKMLLLTLYKLQMFMWSLSLWNILCKKQNCKINLFKQFSAGFQFMQTFVYLYLHTGKHKSENCADAMWHLKTRSTEMHVFNFFSLKLSHVNKGLMRSTASVGCTICSLMCNFHF